MRTPETSSNYLAAGQSISVTVNVTAPATVDPSKNPYTVATQAKRDGDFDDLALTRVGSDPTLTVYPPLDHFQVTAPATASAGAPFDVTVAAKDAANVTITGYTGTVHFSSTDPLNVLPGDYAFHERRRRHAHLHRRRHLQDRQAVAGPDAHRERHRADAPRREARTSSSSRAH